MKPLTWVNELSLRATYGVTGNSPYVGAASQNDIIRATSGIFGQIAGDAFVIGTTANRLLEWESTHNINLGINFAVLDNLPTMNKWRKTFLLESFTLFLSIKAA